MTHENEDQKPIDETTEDEGSPVDPREAQLKEYAVLMEMCYETAGGVLIDKNLVPLFPKLEKTALALFNRCTREMPEQAKIFTLALEYLTTLMKEKEGKKDSLIATGFQPFISSMPPCKHPQLAALRKVLLSEDGGSFSLKGESVIAALSVETFFGPNDPPALCCPACRAILDVEKFRDGSLFSGEKDEETDNEC